jgi:hypothetical protein
MKNFERRPLSQLALGADEPVAVHGSARFHTFIGIAKQKCADAYFIYTVVRRSSVLVINLGEQKQNTEYSSIK